MTDRNIAVAQSEYFRRPEDERFTSLDALLSHGQYERDHSGEARYNLRDLHAITQEPGTTGERARLMLESPKGYASLSHWAFGQLCRTTKSPAAFIGELTPGLAATVLNERIDQAPVGTRVNVLVRKNGGIPHIRACTSETYGRAWDAQLHGEIQRHFGDGRRSLGGQWMTPPAWPGSLPSGNYAGDRDSFVIRVDGGSIVTDPSTGSGAAGADAGQMFRGIMVRNSEVGHCSIQIDTVLYRYICGNHMLWGALWNSRFKRRHVGDNAVRDAITEINRIARAFSQQPGSADEAIIRSLIAHELAHTREAVIDELMKLGATKDQATEAYITCEQTEQASPRSFWGIAQGMTRNSQESGHQDERLKLDALAAQVLKRGALVAA